MEAGGRSLVFELKFLPKDASGLEGKVERLLSEACEQIASRQYGEKNVRERELLRVGTVFSEAKRQFVDWRLF